MLLTPRRLKRYRQIIEVLGRHGFGAILAQLDLDNQLRLPRLFRQRPPWTSEFTAAEHLRLAFEELGPTFIKLGQILSTRPDLVPASYITQLRQLQDNVPPAPWPVIRENLEADLGGPVEQVFAAFETTPLAAASLGQVYAAGLPGGEEVVVKIRRPDITTMIDLDLDILLDLARLGQNTSLGKIYDLPELAADFALILRAELDYRREGRNADRFRDNFRQEPYLYIPQVYWEYTTERVLVTRRLTGIKIDDVEALTAAGYNCRRIATHSARIIIKEILEDGFFHADPHPGNLVVMPGEVIGAMDFGQVGYLEPGDRTDLIQLYLLITQVDTAGIVEHLIEMGVARHWIDRRTLQQEVRRIIRKYQGLPLKDIHVSQVMEDITRIASAHHLRLPANIVALIRVLAIMQGVGLKLDPDFDIFAVAASYGRRFSNRLWLPSAWGPVAVHGAIDWADWLAHFPRQASRVLEQASRNEWGFQLYLPDLPETMLLLDRIANRLALSILMAAFVVALALLIPALNLDWPWGWLTWVVVLGFGLAVLLAMWLLWGIWRSGRR